MDHDTTSQAADPPGLLSLATETIIDIAEYIEEYPRDLTSFMRVCPRTSWIGAYVRYTSIYVCGAKGQALLSMLVSGTALSSEYCLFVKRLWLEGTICVELELLGTLLSQALFFMDNLISFAAEALPIDCSHLLRSMKREGLIRESNHPSLALTVHEGSPDRYSLYTLPNLRTMMLNGDPSLTRSACYRPLTELIVDYFLSESDWATLMTLADGTILGQTLRTLWVKVGRAIDMELAIPMLSRTFPNLEALSLTRGGINLVEVLTDLGRNDPPFPNLRCLWINPEYSYTRLRGLAPSLEHELNCGAMSLLHRAISDHHRRLQTIAIGANVWTIGHFGQFILRDLEEPECMRMAASFGEQVRPCLFRDMPASQQRAMDFASWSWLSFDQD